MDVCDDLFGLVCGGLWCGLWCGLWWFVVWFVVVCATPVICGLNRIFIHTEQIFWNTPQPLYNTIFGVKADCHVSYPNPVMSRVKCIGYIEKNNVK